MHNELVLDLLSKDSSEEILYLFISLSHAKNSGLMTGMQLLIEMYISVPFITFTCNAFNLSAFMLWGKYGKIFKSIFFSCIIPIKFEIN